MNNVIGPEILLISAMSHSVIYEHDSLPQGHYSSPSLLYADSQAEKQWVSILKSEAWLGWGLDHNPLVSGEDTLHKSFITAGKFPFRIKGTLGEEGGGRGRTRFGSKPVACHRTCAEAGTCRDMFPFPALQREFWAGLQLCRACLLYRTGILSMSQYLSSPNVPEH